MPEEARSLGPLRDRHTGSYEPPHLGVGHPTPILRKSNVCNYAPSFSPASKMLHVSYRFIVAGYPLQSINIHKYLNTYRT